MTDTVRWGILGVAGINAAMVPALLACETAELVGIASRSPERANLAAAEIGIVAYTSYEDLLADPRIDAVYVPTPNAHHAEWVIKAARAGKHVLCEKPLAVTSVDAVAMARAAAEAGVLLGEAFMYAHHPRYTHIRQLLADDAIGAVRSINVAFTFDASAELEHSGFQGAPGSGAIYDVGCYAVHVARILIGAEPDAVTAHAATSALHGGIDMSTSLLLEFPDGVAATAQLGMWNADLDSVTIVGARGRIEVPHAFICGVDDGDIVLVDDSGTHSVSVPHVDHYERHVARFTAAVLGENTLLFPIDDAISQARVLEAASHSWRARKRVTISAE